MMRALTAGFLVTGLSALHAADGTWNTAASGNWSDTTKWTAGIVADGGNGSASTAFFNTLDLTGNLTVTLDTVRTNGNLVFADTDASTPASWILSGNKLFLSGPTPTITVSNLVGGNNATISTVLAGTNGFAPAGLTVRGNGLLNLTGANVFTNVLVDGATLGVTVAQSAGVNATNSVVTLTNGATLLIEANYTAIQTINVKGTDKFARTNGLAGGGNWNGMFVGDGTLVMDLANVQMTFGGGNAWNSNLLAGFTGTLILTNGGNFRFDENNAATTTFGSRFATFDLGTSNTMNERGAAGIAAHITYLGALKGGSSTAMAANGNTSGTNSFQIGDLNTTTLFSGRINNGTSTAITAVTKSGTGTLMLDNTNNTYTGVTVVQNGGLMLTNGGALNGTIQINVGPTGTFDVSGTTNGPWSLRGFQSFIGTGTIVGAAGQGIGAIVLTNGTISPGGSSVGTLTFNGDLTYSNTSTMVFDTISPSGSDKIVINGNLNLTGSNTVQLIPSLANVIITNGTYVLFQWTGAFSGDVSSLTLNAPAQIGSLVLSTNASKQIILTVTGAQLIDLTWRGDQGADWQTPLNWRDTNGIATSWADGRVAQFDDSASTKSVTISGPVSPARVLFNNSSAYDFSGVGKITGAGLMVKDGPGRVTVATANDYTGTTAISNGVIQIGNGAAIGSLGSGAITDNGTIAFNRADNLTFAPAISGSGGLFQFGLGALTLTGGSSFTGNTAVSNGSALFIGDGTINGSVLGTIAISNNATLHYFFNNLGAVIVGNSLTGTGNVIYDINNSGASKSSRTITLDTIATNTAFTGSVEVKAGVRLEVTTPYGLPGTNITVDYDGTTPLSGSLYVHGGAVTNTAAISIAGRGPATGVDLPQGFGALRLNNGWSGPIFISGVDAAVNVTTIGAASGTGTILGNISDGGNNFELEYYGGTIQVGPTTGLNRYGVTRITEQLNNPNVSLSTTVIALNTNAFSTNTLNMNGQAILDLNGNNIEFNNLIDESATFAQSNFPPIIQNGSSSNSATITVGRDNNSQAFYGLFGNGGTQPLGLTKTGNGTLTLTGDSTNTGPVTVKGGTLALAQAFGGFFSGYPFLGSGSFSNTTAFAVYNGATLDVTSRADQTLKLNSGQTLKGSSVAIDTINVAGNVDIANGTLLLSLKHGGSPNHDSLTASGSITYNGTLAVTNIGSVLQVNDTFQLFSVSGVSGFTAYNLQANDYINNVKYTWINTVTSNGRITVASVSPLVNTNSTNIVFSVGSGNLTLSWPQDHIGWTLQAQTNTLSAGLGTNWVDVPGSTATNQVIVPINAANGSVFYRMKL
jgi:autotransporter-associated beta strand protein